MAELTRGAPLARSVVPVPACGPGAAAPALGALPLVFKGAEPGSAESPPRRRSARGRVEGLEEAAAPPWSSPGRMAVSGDALGGSVEVFFRWLVLPVPVPAPPPPPPPPPSLAARERGVDDGVVVVVVVLVTPPVFFWWEGLAEREAERFLF